jgi:hypothetical protein
VLPVLQKIFLDKMEALLGVMEDIMWFVDAQTWMVAPQSSHEGVLEEFKHFKPTGKSFPEVHEETFELLRS